MIPSEKNLEVCLKIDLDSLPLLQYNMQLYPSSYMVLEEIITESY